MVWEDKEVGLVMFWKRNRKIARNGMRNEKCELTRGKLMYGRAICNM